MSKLNIARRVGTTSGVDEFKELLDAQLAVFEPFLKQVKIEIRPLILVKFNELIKSAKDKLLTKTGIREDVLNDLIKELDYMESEFKKWDSWSNKQRDAYLNFIRSVEQSRTDLPELELVVQIVERWNAVYDDIASLDNNIKDLSNKLMWKKILSYASVYEAQLSGDADSSSIRKIANLGNTLIRHISESLIEMSNLIKFLPIKISKLREFLQDDVYFKHTLRENRRFDDSEDIIEQKLLDFYNGFSKDSKRLPLLKQ